MVVRPRAVAFDIVETTFSLESLRPLLAAQGLPLAVLETWFARILRDAFALAATDNYAQFRDIAAAALGGLARASGRQLDDGGQKAVLEGFGKFRPYLDAVRIPTLSECNLEKQSGSAPNSSCNSIQ
jgi:2-haloacid dehalogenase